MPLNIGVEPDGDHIALFQGLRSGHHLAGRTIRPAASAAVSRDASSLAVSSTRRSNSRLIACNSSLASFSNCPGLPAREYQYMLLSRSPSILCSTA